MKSGGSTAKKARYSRRMNSQPPDPPSPSTSNSFTLSPKELTLPSMKKIYCLLCHLSLNTRISCSDTSAVLDKEFELLGFKVNGSCIRDLSDVLFRELVWRFQQLGLGMDLWGTAEELKLLLRCCMVVLTLPSADGNKERHQCLISILNGIISKIYDTVKADDGKRSRSSVIHRCSYVGSYNGSGIGKFVVSFLDDCQLHGPLLCQVLEVFADEFLMHNSLRKNLTCHFGHGNIGIVLEAISAHLILSVANEKDFDNFPVRLYWHHDKDLRVPELGLTTVLQLLSNPIMNSAPKILRTHVISLVAEAFGVHDPSENVKPDVGLMDCYLTALKISIDMYRTHMTFLLTDSQPMTGKRYHHSFDSYIFSVTGEKINGLQTRFQTSWGLYLHSKLLKSKADLISISTAYLKDFKDMFDKSLGEEILSRLICLVHETSTGSDANFKDTASRNPQNIFILSAILKLMGCTMSKIIGSLTCYKSKVDVTTFKEYDLIVDFIGCFPELDLYLPTLKSMCNKMDTCLVRHKRLRWMLLHILGLLSLSLGSGLEFLVNSCIFVTMTLMNLFILLEGKSNIIKWLTEVLLIKPSSGLTSYNRDEVCIIRKSTLIIASRFSKVKDCELSSCSPSGPKSTHDYHSEPSENSSSLSYQEEIVDIDENGYGNINGKDFLECLMGQTSLPSDYEDLADFIECKPGKDYSRWLKNRQKYRSWKFKKMSTLRRKKKMATMRTLWGK